LSRCGRACWATSGKTVRAPCQRLSSSNSYSSLGVRGVRIAPWLAAAALICATGMALAQGQVRATVMLDRTGAGAFTGRYYVKVTVENCPTARICSFRLNLPTAYTHDNSPGATNTWVVDMRAGADVYQIQAGSPPVATPVVFAEGVSGTGTKGVQVVALLTATSQTTKHVCDILFTSVGRATTLPIAFEPGSVSVKDQGLNSLTTTGQVVVANNKYGDVDFSGAINALDALSLVAAWRQFASAPGTPLPAFDVAPIQGGGPPNPDTSLSQGDGQINAMDYLSLIAAWRASLSQ